MEPSYIQRFLVIFLADFYFPIESSEYSLSLLGESLRNTMRSLKLLGVEVSHQTVYNWIQKYVYLMRGYAEKITPNVSDT